MPKEWEDLTDEEKQPFFDAADSILRPLRYCNRVWYAWDIGTMSEQDFVPANEKQEILEETAWYLYNNFVPRRTDV